MFTNENLTYVLAALVGAGVGLVAGLPAYFLLLLTCPVMVFFMLMAHTTVSDAGGTQARLRDLPPLTIYPLGVL